MSSVMKAAALDGLGAEVGEELGDGISSWPQACRRGEETVGAVALFSLEVEMLIPFTDGFDCGGPFVVVSLLVLGMVEEVAVVGSADVRRLTEVFCRDGVSASWPTRLLFESLFAVSAGGSLILGPELGDPNAGEWYRLRRALPAPRHLYVPFGFLDNVFVGVFSVFVAMEGMADGEVAGNSGPTVGEFARDGLFEKRNGCSGSSGIGGMSDPSLGKEPDVKGHAYHQRYQYCPEAWILGQRSRPD